MSISNTYKSLIFTTLLTSLVILLGFTIHIKKKAKLIAETYYELDAEPIEEEEKTEELKEILKSFDKLLSPTTNQAYNETKDYENQDINDPEFEEQLEAIKNRTTIEDLKVDQNNTSTTSKNKSNAEASDVFNDINNIVTKRSENQKKTASNNANKNSSISYSLKDRTHTFLPTPVYLCDQGGKIIINITVNNLGNVVKVKYNNTSPSNNGCLIDHALEYAKAAKFNSSPSKASQIGSITFLFKDKL